MTGWNLDRRAFLRAAGAFGAAATLKPSFAWSADGDTLRIRMEGDLQTLDPAFMNGGIEDVIMRGIYVTLNHFGDIRKGSPWAPWGAEKLEQKDPKTIAFFVAVLPQFVDLHHGSVPLQMIELGLVFFVLAVLSDSVWAFVAAAARDWFAKSPKRISALSATGGGMMIGLGGILLFTGNDH